MAPVWTKRTRPWAKAGDWGRAASQMASRPGGEVVDGAALGVGGGDAVVDEPFVQGKVWARAVLGQPVGAGWPGRYAVICPAHMSRWSVGGLQVELAAGQVRARGWGRRVVGIRLLPHQFR